jgi:hypothetical protein
MLDVSKINYVAVLIATVASMVIGFLWYSPILFGNAWMKQRGVKMEEMSGGSPFTYFLTALTQLAGAFVLALLLTLVDHVTIGTGITIGLLIGISISVKIGMNYLFEGSKLGLYFITIGYHLVSYVVAGLILGWMQG